MNQLEIFEIEDEDMPTMRSCGFRFPLTEIPAWFLLRQVLHRVSAAYRVAATCDCRLTPAENNVVGS